MSDPQARRGARWWHVVVLIPFLPLLLVLVAIALTCFVVASVCLHVTIWSWWCLRGRDILFVYSDSPIWHDYIEKRILPRLGERAIVLNWSQRRRWRISIARLAFHHFAGYRQFKSSRGRLSAIPPVRDVSVLATLQGLPARTP